MSRIPSYSERMDMQRQIQEICKTKGAYAKKRFSSFERFERYFLPKCGAMKQSVVNCVKDVKCFISEYVKWAQDGLDVRTEYAAEWFRGFLNMVLKAANHGIKLATTFYNRIIKKRFFKVREDRGGKAFVDPMAQSTSNAMLGPATYATLSLTHCCLSIFAGLVVVVLNLALMTWLKATHRVDTILKTKPSLLDKTKSYYEKVFKDDGDFPDELLPPDPEVPNITMSFINETTNYINEISLKEDPVTLGAGVLFILFLKASIASAYNEEISRKVAILKGAIPSPSTLAYTTLLLYFATHGVAFLG